MAGYVDGWGWLADRLVGWLNETDRLRLADWLNWLKPQSWLHYLSFLFFKKRLVHFYPTWWGKNEQWWGKKELVKNIWKMIFCLLFMPKIIRIILSLFHIDTYTGISCHEYWGLCLRIDMSIKKILHTYDDEATSFYWFRSCIPHKNLLWYIKLWENSFQLITIMLSECTGHFTECSPKRGKNELMWGKNEQIK